MSGSPYAYAGMAAFQVVTGLQQADLMRESNAIAQRIAAMNAEYAEHDAWEVAKFGETQAARYQTEIDGTIATQRANMAAADVDITSGTAKEIQEETRLTGFLNTLDIKAEGQSKAMGLRREAASIRMGAAQRTAQTELDASSTTRTAMIGAAQSGISAYNRW